MGEPIRDSAWKRLRRRGRVLWRDKIKPRVDTWRLPALVVGAVVILAVGYVGFLKHWKARGEPRTCFDLFYYSLQLFIMESGAVEGPVPVELQVARLAAPLLAASAAVGALAVIFREYVERFGLWRCKDHVVICGLGRKGAHLARHFCEKGFAVVVVEGDDGNDDVRPCREQGAWVVIGSATDADALRKAGVDRARLVIAVCGDDGTNVECAMQTYQILKDLRKPAPRPVRCFVHVFDLDLCSWFKKHPICADGRDRLSVSVFNNYENGARLLLHEHPLERGLRRRDDPRQVHLVVVGFGQMGESVVMQAAKVGHYANGKPVRITVVDRRARAKERAFGHRYPQFEKVGAIEFVPGDALTPTLLGQVATWASDPASIVTVVITFDDDALGLRYAMALWEKVAQTPAAIKVRMTEDAGLAILLRPEEARAELCGQVTPFGMISHLCTSDILLAAKLDDLAKATHDYFRAAESKQHRNPDDDVMQPWEALDDLLKDSNRDGAAHIAVKLRTIGCRVADIDEPGEPVTEFAEEAVELMARMEHARWTAQYLLDGWRQGPERDDARRIHPWLIPWDDLPDEAREKNYYFVRIVPDVLRDNGQKVCRVAPAAEEA